MNLIKKICSKILRKFFKKDFDRKVFMMGTAHILNIRKNYDSIKRLEDVDYKIFLQNGEDRILDYLLTCLKTDKHKFIEIGVGDYYESNTRFIFERTSCKGLIIDIIKDFKKKFHKIQKFGVEI